MPDNVKDDNDWADVWSNWAGSLACVPDQIAHPTSVEDVQRLVREQPRGSVIRAFGTGHSWTPLVVANGQTLLDLSRLTEAGTSARRWQKDGELFVTFTPSARWSDVRDALMTTTVTDVPRAYLSSTGALASINATGFVAPGCHGTGWNQQTVSDAVTAVELVGADGQVHVFSDETTPAEMPAVRVSLGTLGIITKLTLRVEPLYRLHDEEVVVPTMNVLGPNPAKTGGEIRPENLHKLLTENDYVELFWFPGSGFDGDVWVKKFNRTTDDVRDVPLRPDGWVDRMADAVMGWTAENPLLWPLVLSQTWQTIKERAAVVQAQHGFVAEAPRVLFYAERAFPILDLEVAFPIPAVGDSTWDVSNVINAWYAALNYAYRKQGDFPLTTCLHARFTKSSRSLLSPAYSTREEDRCCWMEILSAYPKAYANPDSRRAAMRPFDDMANALMPTWIGHMHGRPHWAKYWHKVEPRIDVRSLYPAENIASFNTLRRTLDPNGMFLNSFLKERGVF